MENLKMEEMNLLSLHDCEISEVGGGTLMFSGRAYRIAMGEIVDFARGLWDGFLS
jgi:hypothetical protein